MHLINTTTLKLKEFVSEQDVKYAILSHRWETEEVLFSDMPDIMLCEKLGIRKLRSFLKLVRRLGYEWAWVDTCCIDKKSSAELSESINSMFRWYEAAGICIAYLCDVFATREDLSFQDSFGKSAWFFRCWTLQELLAPHDVVFYNHDWKLIGRKSSISSLISEATLINESALAPNVPLSTFSVAERMSWASCRRATRVEDEAYSLLGLFGVNMPMLYGEGRRAFERLQLEILSITDDETIFAWSWTGNGNMTSSHTCGLLAKCPDDFLGSRKHKSVNLEERSQPWSITSRGITTTLMLDPLGNNIYLAMLNVGKRDLISERCVGIYLQRTPGSNDTYTRITSDAQSLFQNDPTAPGLWLGSYSLLRERRKSAKPARIYVSQRSNMSLLPPLISFAFILPEELLRPRDRPFAKHILSKRIHTPAQISNGGIRLFQQAENVPAHKADTLLRCVKRNGGPGPVCNIDLDGQWLDVQMIHIGVTDLLQPCLIIVIDPTVPPQRSMLSHTSHPVDYNTLPTSSYFKRASKSERLSQGADHISSFNPSQRLWTMVGETSQEVSWRILLKSSSLVIKVLPAARADGLNDKADHVWRVLIYES